VITWLRSKPSPADASADKQAIFHLKAERGRSSNQSDTVAAAKSGTAQKVTKSSISSPTNAWPRSDPFRKWKTVQSIS
jgi:hypothetical protein